MAIEIDSSGFPRLEEDKLELAVTISPTDSGGGNPYHNAFTGQFTFAPPGVRILQGAQHLKSLSTPAKTLITQRVKAAKANAMGARIVNGNLHIVLLNNSQRVDSFAIPPLQTNQQDQQGQTQTGKKPPQQLDPSQ